MENLNGPYAFSVKTEYKSLNDEEIDLSRDAEQALLDLDLTQEDFNLTYAQSLNSLVSLENSCARYRRWAEIDHLAEKLLLGLVTSKNDVNPRAVGCLNQTARFMPYGRSILLYGRWGLSKETAVRSFAHTTEAVLLASVKLFIIIALGVRLKEFAQNGSFDSLEIKSIFQNNDKKGVISLIQLLARFDKTWLQLLLASPVLIGALKALWDGCRSHPLSQSDLLALQEDVARHTTPLKGVTKTTSAYIWYDTLRQKIPCFRCCASVSERIQKAEYDIRSNGSSFVRIRGDLFKNIKQISLEGRGVTRLNAMQSLAKIVHSWSIKDLATLHVAGHRKEVLEQILEIKTEALQILRKLAGKDPAIEPNRSLVSTIYASYLLWWLGMGNCKEKVLFGILKASKKLLQVLFLKEIIESILEAIRCPDKQGFIMFYGEYEIWANELTVECFNEFVRQFRLISPNEKIEPFLNQLKNFHLEGIDSLDLSAKSLTANETQAILQVLTPKMNLKHLKLYNNLIGKEAGKIDFPPGLLSLNLVNNEIGNDVAALLRFPASLETLDLGLNKIGPDGAAKLQLPSSLKSLDLSINYIGSDGAANLRLPSSLKSLSLSINYIGPDGAAKLQLPASLESLNLNSNEIGSDGAAKLKLSASLSSLDLSSNQLGSDRIAELQFPASLRTLDLSSNQLGSDGVAKLELPSSLEELRLYSNGIDSDGAARLQLPLSLRTLELANNQIGPDGAAKLKLPPVLESLDFSSNEIGPDGAAKLQLSTPLKTLNLGNNGIGSDGAAKLKLPPSLETLALGGNGIGPDGAANLRLPSSLRTLYLNGNQIGSDGAAKIQLPPYLELLGLNNNGIDSEGAVKLQLPSSLKSLDLTGNKIGPNGAASLKLPLSLETLTLNDNGIESDGAANLQLPPSLESLTFTSNAIGPEGAAKLQLPASLKSLNLGYNGIGSNGAINLRLPSTLQSLDLPNNHIGALGAAKLQLSPFLKYLDLSNNEIDSDGAANMHFPSSLEALDVRNNQIGDLGVKALLQKVPQTNLTFINLDGNTYNTSTLDERIVLQREALLRRCQDQLCHANTPLQQDSNNPLPQDTDTLSQQFDPPTYEAHFSSATRTMPFFSYLSSPLKAVSARINACVNAIANHIDGSFTSALNNIGSSLRSALSDSPAYFPNLQSPHVYDHALSVTTRALSMSGHRITVISSTNFLAHQNMSYISSS